MSLDPEIEAIINRVIEVEGGYVNNSDDPGGITNFGITERVARANGFKHDMRDLPRELAFEIYLQKYVFAPNYDPFLEISNSLTTELVDTAVNCAISRSSKWLQLSLNKLNRKQDLFADLKVDGKVGPATIAAVDELLPRDEAVLIKMLDSWQGHHYMTRGEWSETFMRGWFAHRIN